jgi:hypothetical protein
MKINYGVLFAGAAIGGVIGWYYMSKIQVPNAYSLGQTNPTTAFGALTAAQMSQLNTQPTLPSPPSLAAVAGSSISGVQTPQSNIAGLGGTATTGTGALLGRRGRLMPIHYRGMGRHG